MVISKKSSLAFSTTTSFIMVHFLGLGVQQLSFMPLKPGSHQAPLQHKKSVFPLS